MSTIAIEDFCATLPNGEDDYWSEVRDLAMRLYAKASPPDTRYFLDKTPRYSLIVDQVCRMFPQGKFLFLWRNPLAVVASIIDTWGHGRWNLHTCTVDLFQGLESLITAYQNHIDRAYAFRYEDIICDPEVHWSKLYEYLGLPFPNNALREFPATRLKGRVGDHTGTRYLGFSSEPLSKWKGTLANPFRKAWCRHYLRWIGAERLAVMGYDLTSLLNDLKSIPMTSRNTTSDLFWAGSALIHDSLEMKIMRDKYKSSTPWYRIFAHR